MPDWSAGVWTAVGLGLGLVGVLLTVLAWWFPRHPRRPAPTAVARDRAAKSGAGGEESEREIENGNLVVEAQNHLPVFDLPDGSSELGEWLVAVSLYNRGDRRVCVSSWGVRVPDGGNMVTFGPVTPFEPLLPHWVEPGTNGTWYLEADKVGQTAAERNLSFDDMIPWVSLADGSRRRRACRCSSCGATRRAVPWTGQRRLCRRR